MEEFAERLSGRLHGMARAYSLLSGSDWTKVALRDPVRTEAEAFRADRISASGPEIALTPQQTRSLGMVVHEMATIRNKTRQEALHRRYKNTVDPLKLVIIRRCG